MQHMSNVDREPMTSVSGTSDIESINSTTHAAGEAAQSTTPTPTITNERTSEAIILRRLPENICDASNGSPGHNLESTALQ